MNNFYCTDIDQSIATCTALSHGSLPPLAAPDLPDFPLTTAALASACTGWEEAITSTDYSTRQTLSSLGGLLTSIQDIDAAIGTKLRSTWQAGE